MSSFHETHPSRGRKTRPSARTRVERKNADLYVQYALVELLEMRQYIDDHPEQAGSFGEGSLDLAISMKLLTK